VLENLQPIFSETAGEQVEQSKARFLGAAICALVLPLAGCASGQRWPLAAGQHPQSFEAEIKKTVTARFLLYLPEGFGDDGRQWPLIVFLHGSGESGNDLEKVKAHGPPKILAEKKDFPFIVVSPQAEAGRRFDEDAIVALLDELVRQLPVDEDRIYLTGLSMGGFATWGWAAQEPERFAAIAPIAGGWEPEEACKLKDIPIWAFHGARDALVPLGPHQEMIDAVIACGGNAKMTVYPEAEHDSWTATYANPELYDWFLQHRRRGQN
jgi:predicted peptidase